MDHFHYRDRVLHCEDVPVPEIAAKFGTPVFIYSQATLLHHLKEIQTAFAAAKPIICYSIKTNGNLSLARLMGQHGAGFDVDLRWRVLPGIAGRAEGGHDCLRRCWQDRR